MKDINLYKTYYCEYAGNIVTAKIIAQTNKFLFVQLDNGEQIKLSYNKLYNTKEEINNKNLQRANLEKAYEGI